MIASCDLGLTRKIVHSFTDGGRRGTLGRDLTGLCRAAGFSTVESSVYVLVGTSFATNRYPSKIVRMMRDWLVSEGTLDAEPFDRWVDELHERDRARTFFYSVNRNLCLCSDS